MNWFTGLSLILALGGASASASEPSASPSPSPGESAIADFFGETPESFRLISKNCGPFDPDCSKKLLRFLSGLHIAAVEVEGGTRFGSEPEDTAIRFSADLASLDGVAGDLEAVTFEVVRLSEREGYRVRFNLEESEVMFFCTDEEGHKHLPFLGMFQNCVPDERWGVGTGLLQFQRDSADARKVMRWAEISAVMSFLQNGNGFDYLHKRLNLAMGTTLDTVWSGAGGSSTIPRLNVALMGMLRSKNNKWEIRGYAGLRPSAVDFDDWGLETRASVIRHVLLSKNVLGSFSIDGQYTRWSRPENSFGPFASGTEEKTRYLGAMFGLRF